MEKLKKIVPIYNTLCYNVVEKTPQLQELRLGKGGYRNEMPVLRLFGEQGGGFPPCGRGEHHPPPAGVPVTTYEKIELIPLMVVKRDGSRQPFDKAKLLGSMLKACEKRSVPIATLERLANEIEQTMQNEMEREVPTTEIGELVMEKLKDVDEVSYVRFASVYRQFKDLNTFMAELTKLLEEK